MIKPCEIVFSNNIIEKEFYELSEEYSLKKFLKGTIKDIQENVFCDIKIPEKLIPKQHIEKYVINNLWKYNLLNGWRLVYPRVTPNKVGILAIILKWFNHKNYEGRFKY